MHTKEYDIGTALGATFQMIKQRSRWMIVWGALLVFLPMLPVIPLLVWMGSNVDVWMSNPDAIDQAGLSMLANASSVFQLVLVIPILAAVCRYILALDPGKNFMGLRLSMDELWVFVVLVAAYVASFLAIMVALVLCLIVGVIVTSAAGNVAGVITGVVLGLICLLPIIWASVRLSLIVPASIDHKTFALVEAWKASKGRFWPLFGTAIITALLALALSMIWMMLLLVVAAIAAVIGNVTGMIEFGTAVEIWNWIPLATICGLIMLVPTLWLTAVTYTLYIAPFASAWRQLKPSQATAQPDFSPAELQG